MVMLYAILFQVPDVVTRGGTESQSDIGRLIIMVCKYNMYVSYNYYQYYDMLAS